MTTGLVDRLRGPGPLVTVELRPPRSGLSAAEGMDTWIDLNHSIRNLALKDIFVFLTDDAVGSREEENLGHLAANVGSDVPLSRLVPFLTCKHTIEHSLLYADRAHSLGFEALTVVGGDTSVGPPRCVPHSYMLRQRIRERQPGLSLGGWANPLVIHESKSSTSARPISRPTSTSHKSCHTTAWIGSRRSSKSAIAEVWMSRAYSASSITGVPIRVRSGGWGSSSRFPPRSWPANSKLAPRREVLAKTLDALRAAGAEKVYISNLGHRRVLDRLAKVIAPSSIGADTSGRP